MNRSSREKRPATPRRSGPRRLRRNGTTAQLAFDEDRLPALGVARRPVDRRQALVASRPRPRRRRRPAALASVRVRLAEPVRPGLRSAPSFSWPVTAAGSRPSSRRSGVLLLAVAAVAAGARTRASASSRRRPSAGGSFSRASRQPPTVASCGEARPARNFARSAAAGRVRQDGQDRSSRPPLAPQRRAAPAALAPPGSSPTSATSVGVPGEVVVLVGAGQEDLGRAAAVEAGRTGEQGVVGPAELGVREQGRVEAGILAGQLGVQLGDAQRPVGVAVEVPVRSACGREPSRASATSCRDLRRARGRAAGPARSGSGCPRPGRRQCRSSRQRPLRAGVRARRPRAGPGCATARGRGRRSPAGKAARKAAQHGRHGRRLAIGRRGV